MPETMNSHILVIDDDSHIRALLQEYLAENGLRVSIASSGAEMSKILNDEAIDLVVLDLRRSHFSISPLAGPVRPLRLNS